MICLVVAPCALAAEAQPALNVGVVDWQKMLDEFQAYQDTQKGFQSFVDEREARLGKEATLRLVTAQEKKEYDDLAAVPAPTDQQKQRMKALEKLSQDREKEMSSLQALAPPTPEQQKRLEELRAIADPREKELQELRASLRKEVTAKEEELMKPLQDRIDRALDELMREQRLAIVLRKEVVLRGGLDITSKLLAKLNRK
jgi:Skp family chaperone for outer membrane proteins